jgi:hypothetical protein
MSNSTYIGGIVRAGPEKNCNQDGYTILVSKKYLPGAVVRLVNFVLAH